MYLHKFTNNFPIYLKFVQICMNKMCLKMYKLPKVLINYYLNLSSIYIYTPIYVCGILLHQQQILFKYNFKLCN